MKKAIVTILILFVLAGSAWAYLFFFRAPQTNVALEFDVPADIRAGKPFTASVSYSNASDRLIKNAKISFILPEDVTFAGYSREQRVLDESIGDLAAGTVGRQEYELLVIGSARSVKHVSAVFRYRLDGSSSEFEERKEFDISVGQSAANLNLAIPERIQNGETFDIVLSYENVSGAELSDLRLKVDYPPSFQFQKASEEPSRGNNEWDIGTLSNGSKGELVLTGNILGPDGSLNSLSASLVSGRGGSEYEVSGQTASITLASSPLSLRITAENDPNYIAHAGDRITYQLRYRNNSPTVLENVNIKATLTGAMFDLTTIESEGNLNSLNNIITWSPASNRQLSRLEYGAEGVVEFTVFAKDNLPLQAGDKNFTMKVQGQIESPTQVSGGRALSLAQAETKVAGRISLEQKVYFRDAQSGILNSGPYPPRVNRPTQYTVHWVIRNYATDATGVKVSATLLSGAKFTGKVKSGLDAKPTWNQDSGVVTWDIGNLAAGKGVVGGTLEAVFQIEHIPGVNQVGSMVPLISQARVVAKDSFTSLSMQAVDDGASTELPDDVSLGNNGQVQL